MSENETAADVVDVVPYEAPPPATLFRSDDPGEIVARATATADALMGAIRRHDEGKPPQARLVSVISGREYPKVECWTLLGTMLGVFPVTVWSRELADGWEARVEARTRDGAVVGAAEAECRRTEKTWARRDSYALRSMAQTRATSKALRQPLGFVATLAGLEATPAEEMPRDQEQEQTGDPKTGRVTLARGWADWTARMDAIGVPPEDAKEWLRQACDEIGLASLESADPEVRKGVFKRANEVLVALSDGTDWAFADEPRKGIAAAFAQAFDGAVVDGPAWRLHPSESERPARFGEPSPEEQSAADAIPFGES